MPDVYDEPSLVSSSPANELPVYYFKLALDFGTTRTAVACLRSEQQDLPSGKTLDPNESIFMITNYPDAPDGKYREHHDVPTELWFPSAKPHGEVVQSRRTASPIVEIMQQEGADELQVIPYDAGFDAEDLAAIAAHQDETLHRIIWGYGVRAKVMDESLEDDAGFTVSKFKLLLDESDSPRTRLPREEAERTIAALIERGWIKQKRDVFQIFLDNLFEHVYQELATRHEFNENCVVEPVLCVPSIWKPGACRLMESCVQEAMEKAGLFAAHGQILPDNFIVSEAEAASMFVFEETRGLIQPGESFGLIDAGGGTVDTGFYGVSANEPLRLCGEHLPEQSDLCGSSYINAAFNTELKQRLSVLSASCFRQGAASRDRIAARATEQFEYVAKRNMKPSEGFIVMVPEMKNGPTKSGVLLGRVYFSKASAEALFMPRLTAIADMMENQLRTALQRNFMFNMVVLTGGFAGSIHLQAYLEERLEQFRQQTGKLVRLQQCQPRSTTFPGTHVARGAILRASRKENGPQRHSRSSYGFLQRELYGEEAEHDEQKALMKYDDTDGLWYIQSINWLIQKSDLIQHDFYQVLQMTHSFEKSTPRLVCEEIYYVADEPMRSHFSHNHINNRAAVREGHITVDVTHLRKQGLLTKRTAQVKDKKTKKKKNSEYWEVELSLVVRVTVRTLVAHAIWPKLENPNDPSQIRPDHILETKRHSIAAAFNYGTE